MSRCLNEYELQAVADNEASREHAAHVQHCPECAERFAARVRLTARATAAAASGELPPSVRDAIRLRLQGSPGAGATTLRPVRTVPQWAWSAPLTAAAAILLF